jgi:predicted MFS family arabinose efflux permease
MVGGLFGAIAAPKFQGRFSITQLVVALTAGGALLFGVAAILAPSPLMAIPIAIPFFISPVTNAALFGALLRKTPADMRGRVNNALLQVATGLAALSPLVAGLLVAHTSSHWAMGAFAPALSVSAVLAIFLKGLRNAEAANPLW